MRAAGAVPAGTRRRYPAVPRQRSLVALADISRGTHLISRWLGTGAGGMLGQDLYAVLSAPRQTVTGAARADLGITSLDACIGSVDGLDVVVNAAS